MTRFRITRRMFRLALALLFALTNPALATASDQRASCTIYYTPRESGFTKARGFNVAPETRPGLKGQYYPADFLRAVKMEGHGRLAHAYQGCSYIFYNGKWGFTDIPKGTRQLPLVPLQSCAVSLNSKKLKPGTWVRPSHESLPGPLQNRWWKISDVGGGVGRRQIDLYWGEDDPSGPGLGVYRPAGTPFTGASDTRLDLSSSNPNPRNAS